MQPGMSVSYVAGVAPVCCSTGLAECPKVACRRSRSDEDVVGTSRVRELERRVRELERLLGRKTMEVEILKETLGPRAGKKPNLQLPSWNGRREGSQ